MPWKKILGAAATVGGALVGGPVGAAVATGAGALLGGGVGKDLGKTQAKRVQNVTAPTGAAVLPAFISLIPGVDLTPVVQFMATVMQTFFGCVIQCPVLLEPSQEAAAAGLLGLLMSALHQGGQNVKKATLPQK